jgi:hypothetical protein
MIPVTEETKKTHKPTIRVQWNTKVCTPDGKVVEEKSGENSLVAGFAACLAGMLSYADGAITEHDITNTLRSCYQFWGYTSSSGAGGIPTNAAYNILTSGIVVGTNNTAVTSDDYKLNTITAAGSAANQLLYMPGVNNAVVTSAPVSSFTLDRLMINHSGGTITIKELGIYAPIAGPNTMCLCRDIIADPGTDIIDGNYMFVRYTISVTT